MPLPSQSPRTADPEKPDAMDDLMPPPPTFLVARRRRAFAAPVFAVLVAATALGSGCRRDDVSRARVPKSGPQEARGGGAPMAGAGMPGMNGDVPPPPSVEGTAALQWTLPGGWTQSLSGGMRFATLKPAAEGKTDVSVVVLPGLAGGELSNVNRWRGQIGLASVDDAGLAASRVAVKSPAGAISLFDFTSDGDKKSRMIAGILTTQEHTWFVKMVGDAEPVGASRTDFLLLLETFHFGQ